MPAVLKRDEYGPLIKEKILSVLNQTDGLTIIEIAKILNIHYTTASKYLLLLEAEKKVIHRDVGMAKMFKVNPNNGNGNGGFA